MLAPRLLQQDLHRDLVLLALVTAVLPLGVVAPAPLVVAFTRATLRRLLPPRLERGCGASERADVLVVVVSGVGEGEVDAAGEGLARRR